MKSIEVVEMFRVPSIAPLSYPQVVMEVLTKGGIRDSLDNHPQGCPDKSVSDRALTCELKKHWH